MAKQSTPRTTQEKPQTEREVMQEPASKTTTTSTTSEESVEKTTEITTNDQPEENVVLADTNAGKNENESNEDVTVVSGATDINDEDHENVKALKIQLDAFKRAVDKPGLVDADFAMAAKLANQITKHVIRYPKTAVLDALLNFFQENKYNAASAKNIMKGSLTLSANDQQQVGYLFNLFMDLANQQNIAINNGLVIQILKRPEIVNYYRRKASVFKQN